jgi:nucleoid-associated protein YgaU
VVVESGDCLWSIAADRLPRGATAAQIDAEWRRWYAANRATVGVDPNLIYPGQVLEPPA